MALVAETTGTNLRSSPAPVKTQELAVAWNPLVEGERSGAEPGQPEKNFFTAKAVA